jgi:uncharacterized protein (TIGR03790 family)
MPRSFGTFMLALFLVAVPASALEPENLLLLVNRNVPEGAKLAQFYRNERGVPADRILELPLPVMDDISFAQYEREVVPAVRNFLRERGLEKRVTCVVTFYGVPLRIRHHQPTPAEREEVNQLLAEQSRLRHAVRVSLESAEAVVKQSRPAFVPVAGFDMPALEARYRNALRLMLTDIAGDAEADRRGPRLSAAVAFVRSMGGPADVLRSFATSTTAEDQARHKEAQDKVKSAVDEIASLQENRYDPAARAALRKLVLEVFGPLDGLRLIQAQLDYLKSDATTASFDSELSLLWWTYYQRSSWQANPLYFATPAGASAHPTLMTCRLDAPQTGQVRDLILTGRKAEREGLKGRLVLDSRNLMARGDQAQVGSYGWYDQSIRNLNELVRAKTKFPVTFDSSPEVLGPGAVQNVALYCGWYSVRNYVPSCRFVPGAVGFHVASYELISLRATNERGWVRGLLNDGIAATLGAVAEPYLIAFPQADEFFPLLMTGKLTLAEVYWKTQPITSWQVSLVGDPLYTPFKTNPALKVEDLPERLRVVFDAPPTTRPAGD